MRAPESYRGREQTWAKHLFLERYLERVARNILSFRDEFVYVDGFSGPWQSKDEELKDTSFAIALDQLRKVRDDYGKIGKSRRIRCLFNDGDAEAHERLQHYLAAIDDIETKAVCRNFEDLVPEIVAYVGDAFSLTFIDPTGWTDFALQKIQDLLRLPGEVIVNLMFDYVNRFVGDPRPEILSTFDPLFGGPDWYEEILSRIHEGQSREDAIVGIYCERLRRFGHFRHVTSTRILKPLTDRVYFHLVYGTGHTKGLIEFRMVEEKAVDDQEQVRDIAKIVHREHRSGQTELFAEPGDQVSPSQAEAERRKRLAQAHAQLRELLSTRKVVEYDEVLGVLLEIPMVWRSDINAWLGDLRASGEIDIRNLGARARVPQFGKGHVIVWRGQQS